MSTNVSFNGVTYAIPAEGDSGWGTVLSNFFISLAANTLSKSGGSFNLTADIDFGSNFGIKVPYIKSKATNPAGAGVFRLGNAEAVSWRNNANSADLTLKVDATDALVFNGSSLSVGGNLVQAAISVLDTSTIDLTFSSNTLSADVIAGSITNTHINSSAAIAYSKLNLAASIVNADIASGAAIAYSKLNLATSIVNADISASAAIALSKLATVTASKALVSDVSGFVSASSVTSTELSYLSGVTSAIQTQINTKSSLAGTENLSNKTFTNKTVFNAEIVGASANDSTAGAALTLALPTTTVVRLTGALTSLAGITAPTGTQFLILSNATGSDLTVTNDATATAANRIVTGTASDLTFKNTASLWLVYDLTTARWRVVGGSGGSTALESSSLSLASSGQIAINSSSSDQVIRVQGSSSPVDLSLTPFSGTPQNLTLVTLVGNDDTNAISISYNDASNGCVGNFSTITLYKYQVVRFRYMASISRWVYVQ